VELVIDTSAPAALDWAAAGVARIAQNVRNLISTFRYEVAYDRTLGIDPALLDKPAETAAAQYIAEVYRVVSLYEPRAMVKDVRFTGVDTDGNMQFQVVVEI
jgi:phage baseplate assembly protein W